MKNKSLIITLIIVLCVLTIFVSTLFVLLLNGKLNMKGLNMFSKTSNKEIYNNNLNGMPEKIFIDVDAAEINIKHSEDETTSLVVYGDEKKNKLNVNYNNNNLKIEYKNKNCHFLCFNNKKGKIDLLVPSTYDKDIIIKSDVGDIDIDSFPNSYLKIDADVGDIDVKDINAAIINGDVGDININSINSYFEIEEDTGDIIINTANINRNSKADIDVGDINIKNINEVNVDAKSDVGKEKINNSSNTSNIKVKLRTDVGDIKVN